jgi:hypothetical protein
VNAKEHFKVSHSFHKGLGDEHAGAAESCHALAEAHDGDIAQRFTELGKRHEALSAAHYGHADHFKTMHQNAASKAVVDELTKNRDAIMPLPAGTSRVAPDNPTLRAVLRPGQKQMEISVDEEFAELVRVETGDEQ